MSNFTLNLTPEVYNYYQSHAFHETDTTAELRRYTQQNYSNRAMMQIAPEQGQFMQLLIKAMQATKILEICYRGKRDGNFHLPWEYQNRYGIRFVGRRTKCVR